MPWYSNFCKGWPRAKKNPGNWIDESTNYTWNIGANPANIYACPPGQRSLIYDLNASMAHAASGDSIKLRFSDNRHSRGDNVSGDSGTVTVYWKDASEQEIIDVSEFIEQNKLASGGFIADAFNYSSNESIKSPIQGLVDKDNWLSVKLPTDMTPGRHMMVWVWSYKNAPQWSICFDILIGSSSLTLAPKPGLSFASVILESAKNSVPSSSLVPIHISAKAIYILPSSKTTPFVTLEIAEFKSSTPATAVSAIIKSALS